MSIRIMVDSLIERTAASLLAEQSGNSPDYDRALLEMVMRLEGLDESDMKTRTTVGRRLRRLQREINAPEPVEPRPYHERKTIGYDRQGDPIKEFP